MDTAPAPEQAAREKVVRVLLLDPERNEPTERTVPGSEFDTTERGIVLGSLFVPWHRVIRYGWELQQEFAPESGIQPRSAIRVRVDDGTPGGTTYTVRGDEFETDAWTLAILVDTHVKTEQALVVVEKVFFPWGRVVEYERGVADEPAPSRPDAPTER